MNTSALGPGLGLTIPTATVRRTVEALLAHGRVRRGYLGVAAQPVRLPAALSERLGQDLGLLLMTIEPDSPAEKSGLYLGDILVGFDGQRLRSLEDLLGALGEDHVGVTTPVRIVRGGQVREMGVTLGERTA
ncbi:MAG: PDZ domain-containing protein [Armatimonadetes bacterium]|nr:PDZ domain-containing protein [Armatimonadota bacterium]